MVKCAWCNRVLASESDLFRSDKPISNYWRQRGNEVQYFCDAKCSLELHEKERALLKLLGGKDDT